MNFASPPDAEAPVRKSKPYIFYGETTSLCGTCSELVSAKIIFEDDKVYYLKRCSVHGVEKVLISTDIPFFKWQKDFLKPGDRPNDLQTRPDYGCPYD